MSAIAETNQNAKQEFLQKKVAIESNSHQSRIQILQNADACIKSATNRESYKACETTEQNDRKALKEQTKANNEALRNEIKSYRENKQPKQR